MRFHTTLARTVSNEIRLADTKASWTFGVIGVASAALTNKLAKLSWEVIQEQRTMILLVITVVLIVFSIKHLIAVIYPRVSKGRTQSILYFGDIASHQEKDYINKISTLTEEEAKKQIARQTYALSCIAKKKFHHLRYGMIYTLLTLLLVIGILVFIV